MNYTVKLPTFIIHNRVKRKLDCRRHLHFGKVDQFNLMNRINNLCQVEKNVCQKKCRSDFSSQGAVLQHDMRELLSKVGIFEVLFHFYFTSILCSLPEASYFQLFCYTLFVLKSHFYLSFCCIWDTYYCDYVQKFPSYICLYQYFI